VAVARFLSCELPFTQIPELIERVLERCPLSDITNIDDVLAADREARACAEECLRQVQRAGKAAPQRALAGAPRG
jgi:1-deoxy-D-xylulose-5-phosphate reductoisomerase